MRWLLAALVLVASEAQAQETTATRPGTMTLAPGLAATPGSYNPGTQTIVGGAGTLSMQAFPETHATSYTVVAADAGKILIATGAAVVFTVPAPAAGTKGQSFSFASDGTNGYTIQATGGASFLGCANNGASAATLVQPPNMTTVIADNQTSYSCTVMGDRPVAVPVSWGPGQNLAAAALPILTARGAITILAIRCAPEAPVTGTATFQIFKTSSGALCSGTNMATNACNAASTTATDFTLISTPTAAANDRIGICATGAGWNPSTGSGVVTLWYR